MKYLFLLMISLSLSSCISTAVKTVVRQTGLEYKLPLPTLYAEGEFSGLREFINTARDTANILLTHGLTDKSENHFDLLAERLATKLKLTLISGRTRIDSGDVMSNDPGKRKLGFNRWKLFQWRFHNDSLNKPVNFYFVYWAPITKPAKDFIHAYNRTEYRTQLSTSVKDSLFINIFGDLAVYLNDDYKVQLRDAFIQSFKNIQGPTVVVGGGFGVQLMFEAIVHDLKGGKAEPTILQAGAGGSAIRELPRDDVAKNKKRTYDIAKVFLLTNQAPFVSLLKLKADDSAETQAHNDLVYRDIREFCLLKQRSIDLVSFYDPNDAFGYQLPNVTDSAIHVINVRVNIAESWWIDPKRTTNFVLPKLKSQKASDVFLSVIDQKASQQDLMLNLKGPADQSRNDYRVMGAICDGTKYKLVCLQRNIPLVQGRSLEYRPRKFLVLLDALGTAVLGYRVVKKLELKTSVLPFSLPSEFRDAERHRDTVKVIRAAPFDGIVKSIDGNDITQVMTVHGVKTQEPDSFDDLVNAIAKSLGFYSRPTSFDIVCAAGESCPQSGPLTQSYLPGTVKRTTFTGVSGQKLIIYAVYWSSIMKPAKDWLNDISIDKESSVVPRTVKKYLINDGFADIELSFGYLRGKVDSTLMTAFRMMDEDHRRFSKQATRNTYYLTGSLGSRLLLDFLSTLRNNDKTVGAVQSRARTWYMLTNQLIMTALKDIPLNDSTKNDLDNAIPYEDFFKTAYGGMADFLDEASPFDIVAFNDPNDLLSFIVPDDVMGISPTQKKIHNTYLNLAKGMNINMDQLIRFARKADNKLLDYHYRVYRKQMRHYASRMKEICAATGLKKTDPEYKDYRDMLRVARKRFVKYYAPDTATDINPTIERLLKDKDRDDWDLYEKLNQKRKFYSYNIYVTRKQKENIDKRYHALVSSQGKRKTIRHKNFDRLFQPGLLMPFVRSMSNFMHYQDFVSDFGRAHVGAKENSKIVQMIAHGYSAVTTTNVDQKLYGEIHNPRHKH